MARKVIAALLVPLRRPRLWLGVVIFEVFSGLALSSPFNLAVAQIGGSGELGRYGDFALWRWITRLHGDSLAIAFGGAIVPAILVLVCWQFLVGGIFGKLSDATGQSRFVHEGARLLLANVRLLLFACLPIVALALILSEQFDALSLRLFDEPNDAESLAILQGLAIWIVGFVFFARIWADIGRAVMVRADRPRALRALKRSTGIVIRRPFSVAFILVLLIGGTVGVGAGTLVLFSRFGEGPVLVPLLLIELCSAVGLAYVRLAALAASGALAWESD